MGGAQPLAATMAGACSLNIECQQSRIDFRLRTRYVDEQASDLDDALARIAYTAAKEGVSSACSATPPTSCPSWSRAACARPGDRPDQRARPGQRLPAEGWTVAQWRRAASRRSRWHAALTARAKQSMRVHVQAMLDFQAWACPRSTTATTSARWRRTRA
jgi:urocanate hydratase